MSDEPDFTMRGGAAICPDLPDYYQSILHPCKNTWQDADNMDNTHPYTAYIWIPTDTFQVPRMRAHVYLEKFRAYSTGASAGGGSVQTSSAGGIHYHKMFGYSQLGGSDTVKRFNARKDDLSPCYAYIQTNSGTSGLWTWQASVDHQHTVTIPNHTHNITYGIYEEAVVGRTLSAALYDKNGVLLHNFGVIQTGEGDVELNMDAYFATLVYGLYELRFTASARLRMRVFFYELSYMYAI